MRVVVAVAVAVGVLSGCAVTPTGPVPPTGPVARADGTFTITRQGESYYTPASQLTAMATQDAEAHGLKNGKKFKAIQSKESPFRSGWAPESELLYRCD
jgi:hypothetical protein